MKNEIKDRNTEQNILDAAEAIFLEKGYSGTTTTEIAKRAGVNHAMLHYYYRTKENLFEIIFEKQVKNIANSFLSIVNDNKTFTEFVVEAIERHFDFISANRDLPRFIVNEVFSHPERIEILKTSIQNIVNDLLNNLQQEIDEYAAKGLCQQADARMLLIDIVSLNVFPFMAAPIVKEAIGYSYKSYDEFLTLRKKENVETVLRKLKIH